MTVTATDTQQFPRDWKIQVDTLDVSRLPIEFKILRSIKSVPNKCVLTVLNLNEDHRGQLLKRNRPSPSSKLAGVQVQIEAGYVGQTSVLFSGDLREVASSTSTTEWKTTLSGDDGGRAYREAQIDTTFTAGTSLGAILQQCAQAMGVGLGNVGGFTSGASIDGYGQSLPHTMTLSGPAPRELTRLLSSMGLTWSIQSGALQVQRKGKPLDAVAILVSPSTGLIGSPEAAIDATVSLGNPQQFGAQAINKVAKPPKPKDPSILKLKLALIPGAVPGRKIVLKSASFSGAYMLTEVEYVGQSWGTDWHCNAVARVY